MTSLRSPDPPQPPTESETSAIQEQLERVHWHIVRGDHLRASVAARAGAVLSTNALVIAGVALAFSLRNHRPSAVLILFAMTALGCVVFSVINAALALITIRSWQNRQFDPQGTHTSFLYSYAEIGAASPTFEDFKHRVITMSAEELLEFALVEFWRCGVLHGYRYRKLRIAVRWLLAALVTFLAAAAASGIR